MEGNLSVNESVTSGGEELSERYHKLFQEYSRIKAQHSVLKKAILKEQDQNVTLSVDNKSKEQELRRIIQQLDTLSFHNQTLTKRVEDLQKMGTPKSSSQWLMRASAKKELEISRNSLEATIADLQGKIEENENLHKEVYEIHSLYTEQLDLYKKKVDELEVEKNLLNEELNKCHMMNENSTLAYKKQKKDAELEIKKIKEDLNKTDENLVSIREGILESEKIQAEQVGVVKQLIGTLGGYDQLYQQLFVHVNKSGNKAIFYQCSSLWNSLMDSLRIALEFEDIRSNHKLPQLETCSFEEYLINEHLPVSNRSWRESMDIFYTPTNILAAVQSVLAIYDTLMEVACENLNEATISQYQDDTFEKVTLERISKDFAEFTKQFHVKSWDAIENDRENLLRKYLSIRIGVDAYIHIIEQTPEKAVGNAHYALLKSLNENSEPLSGIIQSISLVRFEQTEVNGKEKELSVNIGKEFEDSLKECLSHHCILTSRLAMLQKQTSQIISFNLNLHRDYAQLQQELTAQKEKSDQFVMEVNNLKSSIAMHEVAEDSKPESNLEQTLEPENDIKLITIEASTQTLETSPEKNETIKEESEPVRPLSVKGVESDSCKLDESVTEEPVLTPSPNEQVEVKQNTPESESNQEPLQTSLPPSDHLSPNQMSREDFIKRHYEEQLQQLLERARCADSQVLRMRKVSENLDLKLEKSQAEKKALVEQLGEARQQISRTQDELRTTEQNYKTQLDIMTEHIAQLGATIENGQQ
ncbi:hypothetical protein K7432_004389 [Basidiobolus ranarum]|uniref:Protein phosphatase 1 regulatory subunit 21 N-terminal domain-containing protein n=1 Tax=Basidiobolus ranarum TaxID=34480 RepID=A0ABR2W4N2_9FUNG